MRFTRGGHRAAVLGCGPAGLFAAHGLIRNGWDVSIFSKARKSHLYGAQYLHGPIQGLTPEDEVPTMIRYQLEGSISGYREKIYGTMPIKVSPEALAVRHPAWDIRAAYDWAWLRYRDRIEDQMLAPESIPLLARNYDVIVSTIPLPVLCYQRDAHQFHAAKVWAYGDAPDRGQLAPYRPEPGLVECNGTKDVGWYRASNIYGHVTMEWPENRKPPLPGVAEVTKPIYTDCTCYRKGDLRRGKFIPLGRYGQWSKGVLTHHAYTQAAQL